MISMSSYQGKGPFVVSGDTAVNRMCGVHGIALVAGMLLRHVSRDLDHLVASVAPVEVVVEAAGSARQ